MVQRWGGGGGWGQVKQGESSGKVIALLPSFVGYKIKVDYVTSKEASFLKILHL